MTPAQKKVLDAVNARLGQASPETTVRPPPNGADQFWDVLGSGGVGLGEGVIDLLGGIGSGRDAVKAGVGYLADKLGVDRAQAEAAAETGYGTIIPGGSVMPTPAQIRAPIESFTGGFYEPKTTAGEYVRKAAQIAPAVFAGPGGIARKAVTTALSGVGSEGVGQLAEKYGPAGSRPYAEIAGGVLGGGIGAGVRSAPKQIPGATTEQLKRQAGAGYSRARSSGAMMPEADYDAVVNRVVGKAIQAGADPDLTKDVYTAMYRLNDAAGSPKGVDDLDLLRQKLAIPKGSPNANERRIASMMVDEFDNAVGAMAPPEIRQARKIWAQAKKSETIDELKRRADIRGGQFSQSGVENALRTEFRQEAMNAKKMRRYTPDERAAITRVATPSRTEHVVRTIGKLSPSGAIPVLSNIGIGSLGGLAAGSPIVGVPLAIGSAAVGYGAKKLGEHLMQRNVRNLENLVRGGKTGGGSGAGARTAVASAGVITSAIGDASSGKPKDVASGAQSILAAAGSRDAAIARLRAMQERIRPENKAHATIDHLVQEISGQSKGLL